jgi:hypothetical protein
MAVTTTLNYKVSEAHLKQWLETEFGHEDGKPRFSYEVRERRGAVVGCCTWRPDTVNAPAPGAACLTTNLTRN